MKFDEVASDAVTTPTAIQRRAVFAERLLLDLADADSARASAAAVVQALTTVGGARHAEVVLHSRADGPRLLLATSGIDAGHVHQVRLREGDLELSADDAEIPELALERVVIALERTVRRLQQRDRLLEQARTDELTGLLNRRALHERLATELARQHREGGSCSMLLIDLDDFKLVNDLLGHAAGDDVLRTVAAVLTRVGRAADECGRLGGDEFALLLPGADAAGAEIAATRVVDGIRRAGAGVTASVGVATVTGPADDVLADPAALVRAADRALYAAKRAGRDTYAVAEGVTV